MAAAAGKSLEFRESLHGWQSCGILFDNRLGTKTLATGTASSLLRCPPPESDRFEW